MDKESKMKLIDDILVNLRGVIEDYGDDLAGKSAMQLIKEGLEMMETLENKPWSEED